MKTGYTLACKVGGSVCRKCSIYPRPVEELLVVFHRLILALREAGWDGSMWLFVIIQEGPLVVRGLISLIIGHAL